MSPLAERLRKYQACDTSLTLGAERGSDSQVQAEVSSALLQGGKYKEAFPAMLPAGTHAGSLQYLEIVHERLSQSLPVESETLITSRLGLMREPPALATPPSHSSREIDLIMSAWFVNSDAS